MMTAWALWPHANYLLNVKGVRNRMCVDIAMLPTAPTLSFPTPGGILVLWSHSNASMLSRFHTVGSSPANKSLFWVRAEACCVSAYCIYAKSLMCYLTLNINLLHQRNCVHFPKLLQSCCMWDRRFLQMLHWTFYRTFPARSLVKFLENVLSESMGEYTKKISRRLMASEWALDPGATNFLASVTLPDPGNLKTLLLCPRASRSTFKVEKSEFTVPFLSE